MPPTPVVARPFAEEAGKRVTKFLGAGEPLSSGTVSVWLGEIDGSLRAGRDEDAAHYAASTMKLPLVAAAFRLHEHGLLDLDAAVPVHNCFRSAGDGSVFSLHQDDDQDDETWALMGSTATLRRLALHAVVKSGNLATNLVLEHVGPAAVAAVLQDAGCSSSTSLPRGIGDAEARRMGLDNLVTAHDLGRVLAGVGARTLAGSSTCEQIEEVLSRQEHRDKIPAGLPQGTYVANKTGWVSGVSHDAALVRPGDAAPYILVVCVTADLAEAKAAELIAEISSLAWAARR